MTKKQLLKELKRLREYIAVIEDNARRYEQIGKDKERYLELFNNINSGVAVYEVIDDGEDFIIKDFNRAAEKINNIAKENVIERSVLAVFPGVRAFGLFDVFQRVYKTGKPEHHPVSLYKDDRISRWLENYVYKLPSGEIVAVFEDVTQRKKAEAELEKAQQECERKVKERTAELEKKNIALKEILEHIAEEKMAVQQEIATTIEQVLLPIVQKLKRASTPTNLVQIKLLEEGLKELITSPLSNNSISFYSKLSPREIEIGNMIKRGLTSKEIANELNISPATVQKHRQTMRKKLGLTNNKTNLRSYFLKSE